MMMMNNDDDDKLARSGYIWPGAQIKGGRTKQAWNGVGWEKRVIDAG